MAQKADFMSLLLTHLPGVVYCKDFHSQRFEFVNESVFNLIGLSTDRFLQLSRDEFIERVHPEDRYMLGDIKDTADRFFLKYRIRHSAGNYIKITDHAKILRTPAGEADKIIGCFDAAEPPTQRKEKPPKDSSAHLKVKSDFQSTADLLYEGIWQIDNHQKTVYVNPRMAEMLGYAVAEMLGKSLFDFMDEDGKNQAHLRLTEFQQGKNEQHELTFLHKNGQQVYVYLASSPILDTDGKFNGSIAAVSDIGALKQIQWELASKEELIRDTADNLPGHIMSYILRPDGSDEIRFVSQGVQNLYEVSAEDAMRDSSILWERIHPDDLNKMTDSVEESAKNLSPWHLEYRIVMPDGRIKWLQACANPRKLADGSIIWNSITLDETEKITTQKRLSESELKFRSLVEGVDAVIYTFSKDLEFTYVSPSTVKSTGYQPAVLKNKSPFELIHPDDLENFKQFVAAMVESQQPRKGIEYRIIKKDGSSSWRTGSVTPLLDKKGKLTGYLGISYDIDELKQKESQLAEAIAMKDKLFSIIGHDLKSPLNSILGLTEIMADNVIRGDLDEVKELFDWVRKASQKSVDLLSNLLEWARSQTGDIYFAPEVEKVKPLLALSMEMVEEVAAEKQIYISTQVDPGLEVMADANMLRTVLRNLLSNAVKYTFEKGSIELKAQLQDDMVLFEIKDDGIGINPENMNKLFSPDKPHTTPGTNKEKGTGLGLLLCKEFVERQGGEIWVESEPGKGTTFLFTLPALQHDQ